MKANKLSRRLSYVLRHDPKSMNLIIDRRGWVPIDLLLANWDGNESLTKELLERIVAEDNKQRYSFSSDGKCIRANQGHSVDVDLGLSVCVPPILLFHGTSEKNVKSILKQGIQKQKRHHVHLSIDVETAYSVGNRHGNPKIFKVDTKAMYADGFKFFQSVNGVWLTEHVPPLYLELT